MVWQHVDLRGGNFFRAVVLSPSAVPVIDDEVTARRNPELAVLSCVAHVGEPNIRARAALDVVRKLPGEKSKAYFDVILAALHRGARPAFEELIMSGRYEYQSEFARKYVAEGRQEGRTESLLLVLESRGLNVSNEARHRILACTDSQQLDAWLRKAASVASIEELFSTDGGAAAPEHS